MVNLKSAVLYGLLSATVPMTAFAELGRSPREGRIAFATSLPDFCESGWRGRGSGYVAICSLNGRYQARFSDGRILPCGLPRCADHTNEIAAFLNRR